VLVEFGLLLTFPEMQSSLQAESVMVRF